MRLGPIAVKRALLVLIALIVLFLGWRITTFAGLEPAVDLDAPVHPARLVAERLPPLDVEGGRTTRTSVAMEAGSPPRAIDGWLSERALALEARCVDVDGTPLAGVEVIASQAGLASSSESDADGRVRIDRNVAWIDWGLSIESFVLGRKRRPVELFDEGEMQVRIVARRAGHASAETWVQAILGETVQVGELVLFPAGTVSGRVVDESGIPVAGALVGVNSVHLASGPRPGAVRTSGPRRIEAPTDDSGAFAFDDVAAGTIALDARDATGRRGELRRVAVRAGETTEVELVLAAKPARRSIVGRVLSAAGDPVAQAVVVARRVEARDEIEQRSSADELGAFRFACDGETHLAIDAWDSRGLHGGTRVEDVAPGTTDLVLRLDAARTLELDVVRADGAVIGSFGATVYLPHAEGSTADDRFQARFLADEPAGTMYTSLLVRRGLAGPHRIAIPRTPFVVRVASDGLRAQVLGPFDPDRAPQVLRVELAAIPTLHGRVLRDGAPVAGAQVTVCAPLPHGESWLRDGFPSRFLDGAPRARTDREGRFALTIDLPEGSCLRAEARGSAPAESAPLAPGGPDAPAEIVIELARGGDLEGHVVVDSGRDPAGIVVGLTRGDGCARTQRTDRDGRFRFEYLTPGPWFVHEHDTEIQPRMWGSSSEAFGPDRVWPTNTRVAEGRTTYLELDLREPSLLVVEGRALADGRGLGGWSALLLADAYSARTLQRESATTIVGEDGSFAFAVHEPGTYQLRLRQDVDQESGRTIHDTLRIDAARTVWNCAFATGTLTGVAPRDGRRFHLQTKTVAGALSCVPVVLDSENRFRIEGVAAGPVAVVVEPADSVGTDRASWVQLHEVEVPAGGIAHVEIR